MENKKRIFAFVFARGGSKGLINKNILPIGGVPLVGRSINVAKELSIVEEIFLSTDSDEIANIGEFYGANIIERPNYLSADNSAEWDAWRHAVDSVIAKYGDFDIFLSLPATAPLRDSDDVFSCLETFVSDENSDILITVMPSKKSPWFNMVKKDDNGYVTLLNQGKNYSCRQHVPKSYEISTLAYVTTPKHIKKVSSIWSGKVKALEFPYERAIDIDDKFDYDMACQIWYEANKKS